MESVGIACGIVGLWVLFMMAWVVHLRLNPYESMRTSLPYVGVVTLSTAGLLVWLI